MALHRPALLNGPVHLVAGGIDEVDRAAGFALQLLVKDFFEAGASDRSLHLEVAQVATGKILGDGVVVDPGEAQGVRGGRVVRVVTGAGGADLQGRGDGQAFDKPGVLLRRQVVEQHIGQQEGLVDVPVELGDADGFVAVEDEVKLVEVALGHAGPGDAFQLFGRGPLGAVQRAVIALNFPVLRAEFAAQGGEIQHHGKTRAVADKDAAPPVIDVAARAGKNYAALVLQTLALAVEPGLEQLAVHQSAHQQDDHARDDAIEEKQAGIAGAMGFDELAHGARGCRRG